jgi:DNA-binding transcriptional LysR family regulator
MSLDINQLQAFDQIVLQGNFSKAARSLNISQPTISLRIQALEHAVGGPLFIRGGSLLQLTELGRSFLPYARQALASLTTGIDVSQRIVQGKRGRVTIGTLPTLATGFFASALASLYATHPQLDVAVHTGHNRQLAEMLYDNFVQLGLMTWPFFRPEMFILLQIQEPLIVVCHATHSLSRIKSIDNATLIKRGAPFFHTDWSIEVKHWFTQLETQTPIIEVPPQTAHDLVMGGIGAAMLSHSQVKEQLRNGSLVQLSITDMPSFSRESVLVRLKRNEPLSTAADEFVRILRQQAREYCEPNTP